MVNGITAKGIPSEIKRKRAVKSTQRISRLLAAGSGHSGVQALKGNINKICVLIFQE
jgi:hypothetical protein